MKVYISADIEGTAGITDWEEANKSHAAYGEFREEMTAEVVPPARARSPPVAPRS
jgi:D-amino peptidase